MKIKILKAVLILESLMIVMGITVFAFNLIVNKKVEIFKEISPDGNYVLVIHQLGEPDWPFGADHLSVSLYEQKPLNYRVSFHADVANDGCNASYQVTWMKDGVQIALIGSEQPTAYYILPFKSIESL